jgi:hypothetical protein
MGSGGTAPQFLASALDGVVAVRLRNSILERFDSNFGRDTGYRGWSYSYYSEVPPDNYWDGNTTNRTLGFGVPMKISACALDSSTSNESSQT